MPSDPGASAADGGLRGTLGGVWPRKGELPLLAAILLDLMGFGMLIADIQLRAAGMVPRGWPVGRHGWPS